MSGGSSSGMADTAGYVAGPKDVLRQESTSEDTAIRTKLPEDDYFYFHHDEDDRTSRPTLRTKGKHEEMGIVKDQGRTQADTLSRTRIPGVRFLDSPKNKKNEEEFSPKTTASSPAGSISRALLPSEESPVNPRKAHTPNQFPKRTGMEIKVRKMLEDANLDRPLPRSQYDAGPYYEIGSPNRRRDGGKLDIFEKKSKKVEQHELNGDVVEEEQEEPEEDIMEVTKSEEKEMVKKKAVVKRQRHSSGSVGTPIQFFGGRSSTDDDSKSQSPHPKEPTESRYGTPPVSELTRSLPKPKQNNSDFVYGPSLHY